MILGDFLGFVIDLTVVFNLTRSGGFFFGPRPYRCNMKRRRLADASQIPLVDAILNKARVGSRFPGSRSRPGASVARPSQPEPRPIERVIPHPVADTSVLPRRNQSIITPFLCDVVDRNCRLQLSPPPLVCVLLSSCTLRFVWLVVACGNQ